MEGEELPLQNGNGRESPDRDYDDVLLAPPLAVAGGYTAINVDRIQSGDTYQPLFRKESPEPGATPTQNGCEGSHKRGEMDVTSPSAGTDKIVKEIQDLKVEMSSMSRQIHQVQKEVGHQMKALTTTVQRLAMEVTQLRNQLSDIRGSLAHVQSPNLAPLPLRPPPYRAVVATSPRAVTPNSIPQLKESLC